MSAQSGATIRGTMVRNSDGHNKPWLKVFVGLTAVGSVMGWPGDVLPVFQHPLCSLLRWPQCWIWRKCACMIGGCRGSCQWRRGKGAWGTWSGLSSLREYREKTHLIVPRQCCSHCRKGMTKHRRKPVSH